MICAFQPRALEIKQVPIPEIKDDEVLIKGRVWTISNDVHGRKQGDFLSEFPLIPGHEIVGTIAKLGKSLSDFAIGDRVVVDNTLLCENCFFCRRGKHLLCENFNSLGVTVAGGFAEYVAVAGKKVYKIYNLTDEEATLVEPAACAIHGLDRLNAPVGVEVLVIGAGPTGLLLAQLLKLNGASKVVIAANKGIKTRVAQELDCGDEYIELDRENPEAQWAELKKAYPYGFDVVVEATGSEKIANDAINYVRRGGTLLVYGVYSKHDLVHWSPAKIFGDEITIIGSFAQTHCFPRAVKYLDSGKIRVKGMDFQQALDKMNSKEAVKVAVKPATRMPVT
ncbi:hypothetical protein H0H93_004563 [Arthromyces matolae]|nr:hypothetical protein H0H93_004563 [Arthromyces matolae]